MSGQAHQIFLDGLARLAGQSAVPWLPALARRLGDPVTVAVGGRPGVGVRTVTAALVAAGTRVRASGADLAIRVVAEVAKPEDHAALAASDVPTLLILNKADLTGFAGGCPVQAARSRATELAACTGAPTEPMVALLAVAGLDNAVLDEDVLRNLRVLAGEPADLSSPEAFLAGPHRLPRAERARMAERLDVFGIAHALLALRAGPECDAERLRCLLRRVSRVDEVRERIDAVAADVRYGRMLSALAELEALAARDADVDAFLCSAELAAAKMAAAVDVIRAAGIDVGADEGADAQLRRAVHWRRYAAGPVAALHRAAGAEIARGSLRLVAGETA